MCATVKLKHKNKSNNDRDQCNVTNRKTRKTRHEVNNNGKKRIRTQELNK